MNILLVLFLAYIIGSLPTGYLLVKLVNGKDVRKVESGRTGGTNVMRAAGWIAGASAAILDVLKGMSSAWVVRWLMPNINWVFVAAALMVIIGHNNSIFLIERDPDGKVRLRGGAGGAACIGGAIALWHGNWMIIPLALLVFFFIGYASVATISISVLSLLIFLYRTIALNSPWEFILYGVFSLALLLYALRPNLIRLFKGEERIVGLRALRLKKTFQQSKVRHFETTD